MTTWATEVVDTITVGAVTQRRVAMALDSTGLPHVAYYDSANGNLMYAVRSTVPPAAGTWAAEIVDATNDVGDYPSIAIDASEIVHISYYDTTNKNLMYATGNTGSFATSTVEGTGTPANVGKFTDIAINPATGYPAIVYLSESTNAGRIAEWNGASWDFAVCTGVYAGGGCIALTFAANGDCHVTYPRVGVRYNKRTSGVWDSNTNVTGGDTNDRDIALIGSNPWIAYNMMTGDLGLVQYNGSSWDSPVTLDSANDTGAWPHIALDGDGNPGIAYNTDTGPGTGYLRYIKYDGASWAAETVDNSAVCTGLYPALDFHTYNRPRIAYFDQTGGNIMFAYDTTADPVQPMMKRAVAVPGMRHWQPRWY